MNPVLNQNIISQFQTFMSNPAQFLMSRKLNIPQQYQNDPKGAVQYLLNSGAMSQDDLNRLQGMAQDFEKMLK